MCEPKNSIRLCTCGGEELNRRSMWVLYSERRIVGLFMVHGLDYQSSGVESLFQIFLFVLLLPLIILSAFGMIILTVCTLIWRRAPYDWQLKLKSIFVPRKAKYIVKQLNAGEAFDFSYQPNNGDILMVRWGWRKYYFEYSEPAHLSYDAWRVMPVYDARKRLKKKFANEKMRGAAKTCLI